MVIEGIKLVPNNRIYFGFWVLTLVMYLHPLGQSPLDIAVWSLPQLLAPSPKPEVVNRVAGRSLVRKPFED